MSLIDFERHVKNFALNAGHKINRPVQRECFHESTEVLRHLAAGYRAAGEKFRKQANLAANDKEDYRLFCANTLLREFANVTTGLSVRDDEVLAKGLGDAVYTLFLVAQIYGVPLPEILQEIHRIHMDSDDPNLPKSAPKIRQACREGRDRVAKAQR